LRGDFTVNQALHLNPLLGEVKGDRTTDQPHPHHANTIDRPRLRPLPLIHRIDFAHSPMLIDRSA